MLRLHSRLRTFLSLPAGERRLLLEAALLLEGVKLGAKLIPFRSLRRLLDLAARLRREDGLTVSEVVRAVELMSLRTPGLKTCLARALALRLMLVRRGHPATLRIGVIKEPGKEFQAHAWVESGGEVVIGDYELERYSPLLALSGEAT